MGIVQELNEWVKKKITIIFALLSWRTRSIEKVETDLLGEEISVYSLESNRPALAQVTLAGTIIWNGSRMRSFSDTAKQLVLRHEKSHQDRNPLFKGLYFGTVLWFAIGGFLFLEGSWQFLFGAGLEQVAHQWIIGAILMIIFGLFFRIDETLADYHALCYLGEEKFVSGYSEIGENADKTLLSRLLNRLFYTDPQDIVAIRRAIGKLSN